MSHYLREEAILLVPGHWLGAWAWNEVAAVLRVLEHRAIPVTLPGLDPQDADRATRTLAEQADALIALARAARDSSDRRVVIVGHSGANAPISMVLDAEPDLIDRVIWVDSGPVGNGHVFAPDLAEGTIEVPLPAVEVLGQQASLAGLDSAALDRFARLAVPEPATILTGSVELTNDNRNGVPTTIICCSLPSGAAPRGAMRSSWAGAGRGAASKRSACDRPGLRTVTGWLRVKRCGRVGPFGRRL